MTNADATARPSTRSASSPISAVSASLIADGVREARGGGGWVRRGVRRNLSRGVVRMLWRFRHVRIGAKQMSVPSMNLAPVFAGLALEHLRQFFPQRGHALRLPSVRRIGIGKPGMLAAAAHRTGGSIEPIEMKWPQEH